MGRSDFWRTTGTHLRPPWWNLLIESQKWTFYDLGPGGLMKNVDPTIDSLERLPAIS